MHGMLLHLWWLNSTYHFGVIIHPNSNISSFRFSRSRKVFLVSMAFVRNCVISSISLLQDNIYKASWWCQLTSIDFPLLEPYTKIILIFSDLPDWLPYCMIMRWPILPLWFACLSLILNITITAIMVYTDNIRINLVWFISLIPIRESAHNNTVTVTLHVAAINYD